ncbi:uncharacterized protein LY89DRAFT_736620 [Mollisia scopiformis]|uniref:Uncharacterized protein n=1 Tax=Mollisia scopiformis TaxID=149040 RepID=A0A194X335_MOLSC|nr:uncharacterized protein LY89DRAFT_736620 [Mollisia scopiformis]KUJ14593.1 hypothetical protein LY89DRAFT_736620 [Mollisia scopiformis]
MIPFNNTSLVTPPRIIPSLIFKRKESNFQCAIHAKIKARNATETYTRLPRPDGVDILSGNDYLEMLANFDLKSSTDASLDSLRCEMDMFMWYRTDSIELDRGRYLSPCLLYLREGSLNSEEIPPDAKIYDPAWRTIKIVLHNGLQISFNALVLGRLAVNRVSTYWIVVLDEEKHLWALRAAGIDEEELDDDEAWMDDPRWPAPQYDEQKDLFGADLLVVRVCSLASLQHYRKSRQQFSPEPCYSAKCWTSTYALLKASTTAAAEES